MYERSMLWLLPDAAAEARLRPLAMHVRARAAAPQPDFDLHLTLLSGAVAGDAARALDAIAGRTGPLELMPDLGPEGAIRAPDSAGAGSSPFMALYLAIGDRPELAALHRIAVRALSATSSSPRRAPHVSLAYTHARREEKLAWLAEAGDATHITTPLTFDRVAAYAYVPHASPELQLATWRHLGERRLG